MILLHQKRKNCANSRFLQSGGGRARRKHHEIRLFGGGACFVIAMIGFATAEYNSIKLFIPRAWRHLAARFPRNFPDRTEKVFETLLLSLPRQSCGHSTKRRCLYDDWVMRMSGRDAGQIVADWLPDAQFRERHSAIVPGPAEAILAALKAFDAHEDKAVQFMMDLREAPSRLWARLGGTSAIAGQPRFGLHNFTTLEESADALVYGLAGRFWQLDYGLQRVETLEAFAMLQTPRIAKLVMAFTVTPRADGRVDLVTETRVRCVDRASLILFAPYWFAIRLGSGFIRRRILSLAARRAGKLMRQVS